MSKPHSLRLSCVLSRLSAPSKVTSCVHCDRQLAKHHKNYIMTSVKGLRGDTCPAQLVTLDTGCRLVKGYMEMGKDKTNTSCCFPFLH